MAEALNYIWIGLAGGAAAFAHCLGMCGPFALHLASGDPGRGRAALRQILWHAGRITTYVFLGTLAGFLGERIGSIRRWGWIPDALAYAAGAVMVLMGLKVLGLLPVRGRWRRQKEEEEEEEEKETTEAETRGRDARDTRGQDALATPDAPATPGILSGALGSLLGRPTAGGAFALGLATGFLPCPVVVFFLALCVQSRSVPLSMATMAAMGVGTLWSLALAGLAGGAVRSSLRRWGPQVGGTVLVLLGLVTTLRGSDAYHRVLGCPCSGTAKSGEAGAGPAQVAPGERPCCHEDGNAQAMAPMDPYRDLESVGFCCAKGPRVGNWRPNASAVPTGLVLLPSLYPAVNCWAIVTASLRDARQDATLCAVGTNDNSPALPVLGCRSSKEPSAVGTTEPILGKPAQGNRADEHAAFRLAIQTTLTGNPPGP